MWPGKLAQYSSHDACRVVFTRFTHLRLHDLTVFGHSAKESHLGICGFTMVEGSVAIVAKSSIGAWALVQKTARIDVMRDTL